MLRLVLSRILTSMRLISTAMDSSSLLAEMEIREGLSGVWAFCSSWAFIWVTGLEMFR